MGEISTSLCPYNAKVPHAPVVELGEAAIEDITTHVQEYTGYDGFASPVAMRMSMISIPIEKIELGRLTTYPRPS